MHFRLISFELNSDHKQYLDSGISCSFKGKASDENQITWIEILIKSPNEWLHLGTAFPPNPSHNQGRFLASSQDTNYFVIHSSFLHHGTNQIKILSESSEFTFTIIDIEPLSNIAIFRLGENDGTSAEFSSHCKANPPFLSSKFFCSDLESWQSIDFKLSIPAFHPVYTLVVILHPWLSW